MLHTGRAAAGSPLQGENMKHSAWWFGIAMLVGVSFAHGQVAQSHPPVAAAMEAQAGAGLAAGNNALAKDYN